MADEKPKKHSIFYQWPYPLVVFGFGGFFVPEGSPGLSVVMIGAGGFAIITRYLDNRRVARETERVTREAEKVARLKAERVSVEAAAKAAHEADERRIAEEEERRYRAEETAMKENGAYQRLHMQVNELLDYARNLKRDGDNKIPLQASMDVIGRIATQHDLEDRFFQNESIAEDVRLFFSELERADLQNDMVYRRAVRVLRYQKQGTTPASRAQAPEVSDTLQTQEGASVHNNDNNDAGQEKIDGTPLKNQKETTTAWTLKPPPPPWNGIFRARR